MQVDIIGNRVQLRPFHLDDVDDVFAYASDPEVSRYLDWIPHRTLADTESYLRVCLKTGPRMPITFAVESLDGGVIGSVELRIIDPVRRIGEIGYSLARAYWGQGYNIEAGRLILDHAFGDLRLLRIQAVCDVANRRSYRTLEKLGMVRERLLPGHRIRQGRFVDAYLYGVLWREWARLCADLGEPIILPGPPRLQKARVCRESAPPAAVELVSDVRPR